MHFGVNVFRALGVFKVGYGTLIGNINIAFTSLAEKSEANNTSVADNADAMYSASDVDNAITCCFFELHEIKLHSYTTNTF